MKLLSYKYVVKKVMYILMQPCQFMITKSLS